MLLLATNVFTGKLCQVSSVDDVPLDAYKSWTLPRSIVKIHETFQAPITCTHLYMVPDANWSTMIHLFAADQIGAAVLP
jgi:hypothetical protein